MSMEIFCRYTAHCSFFFFFFKEAEFVIGSAHASAQHAVRSSAGGHFLQ